MLKKLFVSLVLFSTFCFAQNNQQRWALNDDGSISWIVNNKNAHYDHIEMSGKSVSVVLRYGVNSEGKFTINKSMVWPLLRTIPNNTHASLMRRINWSPENQILINGRSLQNETIKSISLKGKMFVQSVFDWGKGTEFTLSRLYFPSTEKPALLESYSITNTGTKPISIEIPKTTNTYETAKEKGVDGSYRIETKMDKSGDFVLQPKESLKFDASIAAYKQSQTSIDFNVKNELDKRDTLVNSWMNNLVLETPDKVIDRMFAFSKIRANESIFETKGGPMHGPGGESYYAAIWANDQAEYINPYFPFTGYDYGNQSAMNSYMHFAKFMNNEMKPIPSSIIAEGLDIWNGVGDRGDAAMIAYGATRYALARGSKEEAEKLWTLITWCLDFCKNKLNKEGVVESDTDELEHRFKAGSANLSTSSLYYDALLSAAYLSDNLGKNKASVYNKEAEVLRKNIENYFGNTVEGFKTYAYYKGNTVLRSWICIPLTMGIYDRAAETIKALFSSRLWTENGLLTEAGSSTFWDRSTLYALRGVYQAGETEKATAFLHDYSETRLLGEHVPYAIEAWPEGEQRHLSAESGLYARIITEGLFGIRPIGLSKFKLSPKLPKEWNNMALRKIKAFGKSFDIEIKRLPANHLEVKILNGKKKTFKIKENGSIEYSF